jgi:hypothetical protein
MRFNFSYPEQVFGFHEAYFCSEILRQRRHYSLREVPGNFYDVNDDKLIPAQFSIPFYIKTDYDTGSYGLSSGAGPVLIKRGNDIYKIKRCGLWGSGIVKKVKVETKLEINSREVFEKDASYEYLGCCDKRDSIALIRNLRLLESYGLNTAYEPMGIYEIPVHSSPRRNREAGFYATIVKINSDLRLDEFILMIILPHLYKYLEKKHIIFSNGTFEIKNISVDQFLQNELKGIAEKSTILMHALGRKLKEMHMKDLVIGHLNTWVGNQVIDPRGEISFIDVEDLFQRKQIGDGVFQSLKRINYSEILVSLYDQFEVFRSVIFLSIGALLRKEFEVGYNQPVNVSLDISYLQEVVKQYLDIYPGLVNILKANE